MLCKTRLTVIQYAGDFREAAERLRSGGAENYRGQAYTVNYVESLADDVASVTTIAGVTEQVYDEILPSRARAIGAGFTDKVNGAFMAKLAAATNPDLIVLRAPIRAVMRYAIKHRIRTLVLLADSFNGGSLKGRLSRALTLRLLRHPIFDVVANHGRRAAEELVKGGVPREKVLAWDFPAFNTPCERPVKHSPSSARKLLYVGLITADKGVDDLLHAVALTKQAGHPISLDLIGRGETERIAAMIEGLGLSSEVQMLGIIPNTEIIGRMAAADAVVVPSRHIYSEGMPLTIYEAYCSRTPLIASDHPMFLGNVSHGESGLVFEAGHADALAAAIEALFGDPDLYGRLSHGGAEAWERLQNPVKWHDLIDHWLSNTPEDRAWIASHALAVAAEL